MIVAEAIVEHLKPIQEKIYRYLSNPEYLISILTKGNEKAQEIASKTWVEVQCKVGMNCELGNKSRIKVNKQ